MQYPSKKAFFIRWKVGLWAVKAKTWLVIADCHHLPPTLTMVNLLSGTSQPVVMWKSRLLLGKNFEALNFIRISGLKYPQACWCYLWIVSVWTRPERQNVLHLCEISHPCSYVPPEWRKHHIVQNISPLLWCCIHPLTLKVTRCDHFYLRHPIHHYVAWRSPICSSCSNLCFLGYV